MDLDDTETRDVVFVAQVGTGDEHDSTASAADFVRRSTPAPYPTSPQDINQIMDLGDTETRDVVFASEADAHNIDSEVVSLVCRLTPAPSDLLRITRSCISAIQGLGVSFSLRKRK